MPYLFDNMHSMSIAGAGRKSKDQSEDAFRLASSSIVLMDGASVVNGDENHFYSDASDAAWLAREGSLLISSLLENPSIDEKAAVAYALTELEGIYADTVRPVSCGTTPADLPSSTLSIARIVDDEFRVSQLGDSPISVKLANGKFICLPGDRNLDGWDKRNKSIVAKKLADGMQLDDIRTELAPVFSDIRRYHCNNGAPGSYRIFCFSGAHFACPQTVCLPASEVESVCVYSDGYSEMFLFEPELTMEELHEQTMRSIPSCMGKLLSYQEFDSDCTRYPRFKKRDDITVVAATVQMIDELSAM